MRIIRSALAIRLPRSRGPKVDINSVSKIAQRSHARSQASDSGFNVRIFPTLRLTEVKHPKLTGIYGDSKSVFPKRMRFLEPRAADSMGSILDRLGADIAFSDMWRSSLASLRRKYEGRVIPRRGVKPPAFSAHNYGLAVDVAVDRTLESLNMRDKKELDRLLGEYGWWCHRLDGKRGAEDWHYNYLGVKNTPITYRTSGLIELRIKALYAACWELDSTSVQMSLRVCGLYEGEIDGKIGPHTIQAVKAFQRAFKLAVDGKVGPTTGRVLWFRAAELTCPALSKLWGR